MVTQAMAREPRILELVSDDWCFQSSRHFTSRLGSKNQKEKVKTETYLFLSIRREIFWKAGKKVGPRARVRGRLSFS